MHLRSTTNLSSPAYPLNPDDQEVIDSFLASYQSTQLENLEAEHPAPTEFPSSGLNQETEYNEQRLDDLFEEVLVAFLNEGVLDSLIRKSGLNKDHLKLCKDGEEFKEQLVRAIVCFDEAIRLAATYIRGTPVAHIRQLAVDAYCAYGSKTRSRKLNPFNAWNSMCRGQDFDIEAHDRAIEAKGIRADDTSRVANGVRLGLSNQVKALSYHAVKQDDVYMASIQTEMQARKRKAKTQSVNTNDEARRLIQQIEVLMDSLHEYGYGALFYVADGSPSTRIQPTQLLSSKVTALGADFDLLLRDYRFGPAMFAECVASYGWINNVLKNRNIPFLNTQLFKMTAGQQWDEWRQAILSDEPALKNHTAQTRQSQQRAQFGHLLRTKINEASPDRPPMSQLPPCDKFDRTLAARYGLGVYFKVPQDTDCQRFTRTELVYHPRILKTRPGLIDILTEECKAGNIEVAKSNPWIHERGILVDCPSSVESQKPGVYQGGQWVRESHHTRDDDTIIQDYGKGSKTGGSKVKQRKAVMRKRLQLQSIVPERFDVAVFQNGE